MSSTERSTAIRLFSAGIGALALWLVGAYAVMPRIIRSAYDGASFELINGLIRGQQYHPVERYLDAGARLARLGTIGLVAVMVLVALGLRFRDPITRVAASVFRAPPRAGLARLLLSAMGMGIGFGLLEAGISRIRFSGSLTTFRNPDTLWLAPLALAMLFVALTLVIFLLSGGRKGGLSRRVVVATCVTIGICSILPGLRLGFHPGAVWLISFGVGIQLARILESRVRFWRVMEIGSLPALAGIALVPVLFYPSATRYGVEPPGEHADASSAPNVLLLVLDTVRGESLGFGGYQRSTTPNLDRLARSGVVFDRAIAPSPWTLPSHASMFTGRYLHELGVAWDRPLPDAFHTLAEALGTRGFARGGFVANHTNAGRGTGLEQGFNFYVDHPRSLGTLLYSAFATRRLHDLVWPRLPTRWASATRRYAPQVNDEFLQWIDGLDGGPFFGFINYIDAHAPYEEHVDFSARFEPESRSTIFSRDGREGPATGSLARDIDAYDSSIALIDHHIGELLQELRERGLLENTVVIVTSDHGEQLGERGLIDHGNSLYAQLLVVPLLMHWPAGLPEGVRVGTSVSLRDIGATIEDLTGLGTPTLPGESMVRLWSAEDSVRTGTALAEVEASPHDGFAPGPNRLGDMKSIVLGPLHYILNGDGSEELFDLDSDPRGQTDLVATPTGTRELPGLRARLERMLASQAATDSAALEAAPQAAPVAALGRR